MAGDNSDDTPADWEVATRLVRGGTARSSFGETAEALYLTQSFVYASAEAADALQAHGDILAARLGEAADELGLVGRVPRAQRGPENLEALPEDLREEPARKESVASRSLTRHPSAASPCPVVP